jgi:Ca2+-binding EF-hand superfamily protein
MDENFDGRISYNELKEYMRKLGFEVSKDTAIETLKKKPFETFIWRDKGLELIIRLLNNNLNKKSFEEFFKQFDADHDHHLTPAEFRQALLSLKDN